MQAETRAVADAPPGTRNDQLNRSAYALGRFVAAGQLTFDDLTDQLGTAAARPA